LDRVGEIKAKLQYSSKVQDLQESLPAASNTNKQRDARVARVQKVRASSERESTMRTSMLTRRAV